MLCEVIEVDTIIYKEEELSSDIISKLAQEILDW